MMSPINIGVSGFNAASDRIQKSANNLANQFSTSQVKDGVVTDEPYVPQTVQAISEPGGGVTTKLIGKTPATVMTPNGDGTTSELPNVDTAEELVNMQLASYDAKANLATIKVQNQMSQSLLDIFV